MADVAARSVRVLVAPSNAPARAVQVSWADWHPTVADLAQAVALGHGSLWVDGQFCLDDELIDSLDLHDGSVVADRGTHDAPPSGETSRAVDLRIEHVAGFAAGALLAVEPGPFAARRFQWAGESSGAAGIAGGAGPVLPSVLAPPAAIFEITAASTELPVASDRVSNGRGAQWSPGEFRLLGSDLFALHQTDAETQRPQGGSGLVRGQRVLRRSPRMIEPVDLDAIEVPAAPPEPKPPSRLSWAVMLAPLPIGILIALLFRPLFLLFTALGPVMALGRWLEGRVRYRRDMATWRAELLANDTALKAVVEKAAATHAAHLRERSPTIAEIAERARTAGTGLWERRCDHDDFCEVVVGFENRTWHPPLAGVDASDDVATTLQHVPHVVRIDGESVIGVVGPEVHRRALARAIVVQLAGLQGPGDLGIDAGLGVDSDQRVDSDHRDDSDQRANSGHRDEWDWCKWLPHAATTHCAMDSATPDRLVLSLDSGAERTGPALVGAPTVEALPARCTQVIVLEDARARILDLARGNSTSGLLPVGCSVQFAERFARMLAPVRDGDAQEHVAPMPDTVALVELDVAADAEAIRSGWGAAAAQTTRTLEACLGSDGHPVTVDLVADGPHALVAGTTGSGKSEMLRTLVTGLSVAYPPDRCSFVLVDFKGGGAFDVLAPLPHVAAVVTDLEHGVAERALRSLRAELRRREHVLRDAGVSDLRDCSIDQTTPPRLVIVVDEFATLANDAPEFLEGLIDTAQRGRSLGVHLVLATQRPAGVVDNRIRANTNLRLCLRVSDATDSRDVIGTVDAADLPTSAAGRAWMRVGPEPPRLFQCAHTGPGPARPASGQITVAPFALAVDSSGIGSRGAGSRRVDAAGAVETQPLVAAIAEASRGRESNSPPWLPALAEPLVTDDLWGLHWEDPALVPLGRHDLPDEQTQPVCSWEPHTGALAVIGGTDEERSAVADLIGQAAMERRVVHGLDAPGVVTIGRPTEGAQRISPLDTERISRALDWFGAQRAAGTGSGEGAPTLVIEDYGRLCEDADARERSDVLERINSVISGADGEGAVVVMAATERALAPRVLAACGTRIVLALADPAGYGALGVRMRSVPNLGRLGGIDAPHGTVVRLATATTTHRVRTPDIGRVPDSVALDDLTAAELSTDSEGDAGGALAIVVGVGHGTLATTRVVPKGRPFLIAGEQGSGRTALCRELIDSISRSHPATSIVATARNESDVAELRAAGADCARPHTEIVAVLKDAVLKSNVFEETHGSSLVIIVDDADDLDEATTAALLEAGADNGSTLVVAGSVRLFRSVRSPWSRLADARCGVALGRGTSMSDVWGVRPRWYPGVAFGRGDAAAIDGDLVTAVRVPHSAAGSAKDAFLHEL